MKIVVVGTRSDKFTAEEFAPHLDAEAKRALQFVAEDFFREIYSRSDGKGAIIVLEASSEEEARARMSELPLVQTGMLELEFYPVQPYRAFVAAAQA